MYTNAALEMSISLWIDLVFVGSKTNLVVVARQAKQTSFNGAPVRCSNPTL